MNNIIDMEEFFIACFNLGNELQDKEEWTYIENNFVKELDKISDLIIK